MHHLVFGIHAITESLKRRPEDVIQVVIVKGRTFENLHPVLEMAREHRIPVHEKDKDDFLKWIQRLYGRSQIHHQGIIAEVRRRVVLSLEQVLETAKDKREMLIVLCDDLSDPHNLGAIVRSVACAGGDAVLIPKRGAAQVTPAVVTVSAGGTEHIPVCRVSNMNSALSLLKENGFFLIGLDAGASQSIYQSDLKGRIGLVIGNEEIGLKRLIRENCDLLVKIPMGGSLNSLNASVAAGIAIFEAMRQRGSLQKSA